MEINADVTVKVDMVEKYLCLPLYYLHTICFLARDDDIDARHCHARN